MNSETCEDAAPMVFQILLYRTGVECNCRNIGILRKLITKEYADILFITNIKSVCQ